MKMRANGEDINYYHYKGEVTEMSEGYNNWMEKNADRIERVQSLPYWIKDNPQYTEKATGLTLNEKGKSKVDVWLGTLSKDEQDNVMRQLHEGISPTVIQNSVVKSISHSVQTCIFLYNVNFRKF